MEGGAKSDEFISLCMAVGDAALQFITSDQVNLHRNIYVIMLLSFVMIVKHLML